MSRVRSKGMLSSGMLACVLFACSSVSSQAPVDAGIDTDASTAAAPDGEARPIGVNNECNALAPIHPIADCDACTRTRCCPEVLQCEGAADCTSLRACLAKCAAGDFACSDACRINHDRGTQALAGIDLCASVQCADPCGNATISADAGR